MTTTTTTTVTTVTTTTTTEIADVVTRLVFVLDRSGSMGSIKEEAMGGFNAFVDGQRKVEGEANLTLVIFDNEIDTIHDSVALADVPVLDGTVYVPRGMTSLNDAVGMTIGKIRATQKPNEKVLFAILTDGQENSSREFSGQQVADLIKEMETEHNWEVMFLGANIDVKSVAQTYNIQHGKFAQFTASGAGTEATYDALNAKMTGYRGVAMGIAGAAAAADADLQDLYNSAVDTK